MANLERHLILQAVTLPPAAEWSPPPQDWAVVRVGEGVGYWLHHGDVRELRAGDGFIVCRLPQLAVRASQLSRLRLEFYLVQPSLLNGLLTIAEGNRLEQIAHSLNGQIIFFKAAEALGQKFSRLVQQSQPQSLPSRAALCQLWSQAVAGLLSRPPVEERGYKLRRRFRQLVEQMPDAELARQSLARLAEMLDCSERHFGRLFRQEFGLSLRARQTELRLQRASQLLANPHDKISHVAFESGYRRLSLFNAVFKKHFGLTPREWRQLHVATATPDKTNDSPPENQS